jgi:hypothetical protein
MSGGKPDHAASGQQTNQADQEAATSAPESTVADDSLKGNASFWSHMCSYDSAPKPVPPVKEAAPSAPAGSPSKAAVWLSAFKSMQLSSMFEGLSFSPNFKSFALLAGFAGWLVVLNFVRQHDQGPNKMVSNPSSNINLSVANPSDRALVSAVSGAYPYGLSAAPGPTVEHQVRMAAGPGQAMSANYSSDQRFGTPGDYFSAARMSPSPINAQEPILPSLIQPVQPMPVPRGNEWSSPPAYNIQMNSVNGTWLKTIVTR